MGRKPLAILLVLVAGAVVVFLGLRSLVGKEMSAAGPGSRAPAFEVLTVDSIPRTKRLADYRGQVLLINIWATWCAPCRVEMPSIEKLHRAYAPRGLKVLAVSVDDPGMEPQIRSFTREFGLTFEVLHDPEGSAGRVSRAYQTSGYPETVIVGRDGIIRKRLLGAHDWNSAENRELIEQLLAEKAE